jgi:hypothetical protein
MLNNVNLLAYAPKETHQECHVSQKLYVESVLVLLNLCVHFSLFQMPRPQTLTIRSGSVQLAYSFLPFTLEFRLLSKQASLLSILNDSNQTLLEIFVDENLSLALEAEAKQIRQTSLPGTIFYYDNIDCF